MILGRLLTLNYPVSDDINLVSSYMFNYVTAIEGEWVDITTDATGQYLAATADNSYVFISSDYGSTWTASSLDG